MTTEEIKKKFEEDLAWVREYEISQGRKPCGDTILSKDLRCYKSDLQREIWLKENCLVGTKVYFPDYSDIKEGIVSSIRRCRWSPSYNGHVIEDPGTHDMYTAQFGPYKVESQTYEYKFFVKLEDAQRRFIRELDYQIRDKERDIVKLKQLVLENTPDTRDILPRVLT